MRNRVTTSTLDGMKLPPIPTTAEINAMTPAQHKIYENRLRRAARRQHLRLEKSRSKDPRVANYGTYWLLDARTDAVVCGDTYNGYGMSLDEIDAALRAAR